VRNAAEEDTVALASQRGMVVCIGCNDDKVWFCQPALQKSAIILELNRVVIYVWHTCGKSKSLISV
jgi:hypothetical protein